MADARTLAAALRYVDRLNWAVFPTGPDCKPGSLRKLGPVADGEPKMIACYDATKDPAAIAAMWERYPTANVSAATGEVSGILVLDIDAKGEIDGFASLARLEAKNGPLPASWRSLTPSGGEHRYFRFPDGRELRNKVGLRIYHPDGSRTVFPGLDIRTTGGAIALPPSAKPHGPYSWAVRPLEIALPDAPEWLLELASDPPLPPRRPMPAARLGNMDRAERYVESAVNGECRDLAGMGKGSGRNLRLFQAAANLGELVGAGVLPQDTAERALSDAAADCGLLQEDGIHSVRQTIASGMRKGLSRPREMAR